MSETYLSKIQITPEISTRSGYHTNTLYLKFAAKGKCKYCCFRSLEINIKHNEGLDGLIENFGNLLEGLKKLKEWEPEKQ